MEVSVFVYYFNEKKRKIRDEKQNLYFQFADGGVNEHRNVH